MTNKPARVLGMALISEQARNGAHVIKVLLVQEQIHMMRFLPVRCHIGWDDYTVHECKNIHRNGVLPLEFRNLFYRHGPRAAL